MKLFKTKNFFKNLGTIKRIKKTVKKI